MGSNQVPRVHRRIMELDRRIVTRECCTCRALDMRRRLIWQYDRSLFLRPFPLRRNFIRPLPFAVFTRGRPTLTQGYVRNVEQPDS